MTEKSRRRIPTRAPDLPVKSAVAFARNYATREQTLGWESGNKFVPQRPGRSRNCAQVSRTLSNPACFPIRGEKELLAELDDGRGANYD
jgi:hypothetical protein